LTNIDVWVIMATYIDIHRSGGFEMRSLIARWTRQSPTAELCETCGACDARCRARRRREAARTAALAGGLR
jgi:hypothetical protein